MECPASTPLAVAGRGQAMSLSIALITDDMGSFYLLNRPLASLRNPYIDVWPKGLRTSPSSGQAAFTSQLRHLELLACHSGAALGPPLAMWPAC